jgi:hypothetical protein
MLCHASFLATAASHRLMPKGVSATELIILGVILLFILWRFFGAKRRKDEQEEALARMGFRQIPREQVFGTDWRAAAHVILDRPDSTISPSVGVGTSSRGKTAVFDFSHGGGSNSGRSTYFTVVGFPAPAATPDFSIAHHALLDRFVHSQSPAQAGAAATEPAAPTRLGPFKLVRRGPDKPMQREVAFDDNPDFAKKYVVWSTDPDQIRSMVSRRLMDQLVALDAANLNIRAGEGWIFVYHQASSAKPPAQYAALLDEAVQLVSRIQFPAADPPRG